MDRIFSEIFTDLPRQGPGDVLLTRKCFESIANLQDRKSVLDVGCGTGFQTVYLALSSDFSITAVDNHQPYLDELDQRAKDLNLSHRIVTRSMSMENLLLAEASFDIILSEGAIYIMGVENGLNHWKQFLKPEGHIIFSDLCWVKRPKDNELIDFWRQEYPSMMSLEEMERTILVNGYRIVDKHMLSNHGWVNNYYYPLQLNVIKCRSKYADDLEALGAIGSVQKEIDLFYKYNEYFSYFFFVVGLE